MKNGEQPINPQMYTQVSETDFQPLKDGQKTGHERKFSGLTKREYFAAMAMQGFISNPNYDGAVGEVIISRCVQFANRLLKELEKPE